MATFHVQAIENLGFSNTQISIIYSLISLPGLLAILVPKIVGRFSSKKTTSCLCILVAISIILVSHAQQWLVIALAMIAIATGQILIYTIACTLSTETADNSAAAQRNLARLRSYGPLATLSASILIIVLLPFTSYKLLFISQACLLVAVAVYTFKYSKWYPTKIRTTKIRIDPSLWSYYLMNFLSGSRSALFKAFVISLLVREYDFNMSGTAWLAIASGIASFLGYRLIAELSLRLRPRVILGFVYTLVGFLFIGFALIKSPFILVVLFIVDSLIFGVSTVTDGTLKSLTKSKELAGQLGNGLVMFHTAGIILPAIGGLLAATSDDLTTVFLFAAALAWVAAIVSQIHCAIADKSSLNTTVDGVL